MEGVERWGYNALFHLRGSIQPQTPIVIVSIGEDSFDELDLQWPWPRALHGQFLDIIKTGKPATIGFDIVFPEPSSRGPEDDRALAEAVKRAGNVVLGAAFTEVMTPAGQKVDLNPPIPAIRAYAAAYGFVNPIQDEDAFVRSASLSRLYQGKEVPSFDLQLYRQGMKAGFRASPLLKKQRVFINFRGGPQTFLTIPYYQVLNGEVEPEVFAGAIVLVGATSPILHDVFPTPFATRGEMPGVEIHANLLETLFQGIPLTRESIWVSAVLTLLAGLLAVWVTDRLRPFPTIGLILVVTATYAASVYALFVWGRLCMDVAAVPSALILGYGTTVVENYIQEQRQRALLMKLFSRHVSRDIAESIWQQRDQFMEEGRPRSQMQMVTILFTDLKGFTAVSEKLHPQKLLDWLNVYMEAMALLVSKHKGVVDDYVGDAIKADFGIPVARTSEEEIRQDAINAVNCALAMEQELQRLNKLYQEQQLPTVGMRVGIATGMVVAGSLGSKDRLKYTTVGDTVNVASRLESFEKDLTADPYFKRSPCRILIEEMTLQYVGKEYKTQKIGEVAVKGREQKIKIFRVLGREDGTEPAMSLRSAPRIKVDAAVSITVEKTTVEVPTYDISKGGLAVYKLTLQLDKGELVQMRLRLTADAPPVVVNAKVAWSSGEKAGFAFLDLAPRDEAAIERFLVTQGPVS